MGAEISQEPESPTIARHKNPIEELPNNFNEEEKKIYEDTNKKRYVYRDDSDEDDNTPVA